MTDLTKAIAGLTPEQLQLLQLRLGKIKGETPGEPAQRSIPVRSRDTDRFPLSPAQLRFWFLDRLQPGTAAYNIPVAARLRGDLDRAALERAFGALVERHESLRTTFAEEAGQPFQVVQPPAATALPFTDLGHLPAEQRETDMRRRAAAEAATPFDLQRGPLVRFSLLALGPDEHVALLTLHHILADRWSVGVFFRELMALYEAFRAGRPSPLPPPRLQYADYACWQKERLEEGELLERQLAWWKERLAGIPAGLPLPTDRPRPRGPRAAFRQRHLPFALERGLADALRALGRSAEASLSMVLLAAFQALLARLSKQDDVVVGSPIANRGRFGLQDLIGYFAQDLVLRTDLSGDPSFRELLGRVREVTLGAYDHADVPFEKLIEALRPDRGAGGQNPFSQIFFVLENVPMPSAGPAGLAIEGVEVERQAGQFELLAYLAESEDGVSGSLFYDADLFEDDTLRLFAASLRSFLERAVADPETRLSALPLAGGLEARAEAARLRDEEREIAVAATFTADPVAEPLAVWMEELGVPARVEMAPFNQVFQQLLDPASRFSHNSASKARGANIVLLRFEDWERDGAADVDANLRELAAALRAAAVRSRVPFLAAVCPASPGNEARSAERERELAAALDGAAGVHLVGADEALRLYPVARVHDPAADEIGRVPYTEAFFAALGTLLARKIHALRGNPYKVIAVDCDNTLWSGVCGEDGPEGVRIDGPRRALQELLVAQHGAGALICLCSKNSAADVDEVFARRSDMPLRPEHVVARRVDWQPKSANLRALAAELGLGLDSFLVIDDNPVECAEIRAHCPEALVLQLPEREEDLPRFLRDTWAFDRLQVTDEDRRRTELYRQNAERERFRGEAPTFEAFLAGLGLEAAIRAVDPKTAPETLARLSQLTWRTNQFNATTRRRSEAELRELLAAGTEMRTVEVRDRFGDYGLVGALMFRTAGGALEVDTFLLSCRVLGKGVEHRMLAELGRLALERGLAEVRVPFVPTARNRPALDFLESAGGAWREADGEGLLFRFPAAQAAETTLTPAAAPAAVADDAPAASPVDRGGDADLLRRIAALSDPAVVLERVRARRRVAGPDGEVEYVAPRTPIEEMLAEIWMELLGAGRVGVHDSFFRLGGHSLLGTVLLSRLRDAFEVEIPLFALFEAPTLGGLAARVEETLIRDSGAEIEEGLAELAGLSDEEVRALLEAEGEGLAEWRDLAR